MSTMDAAEASLMPDIEIIPAGSLTLLVNHLSGVAPIDPRPRDEIETSESLIGSGLQEITG